MTFAERLSGWNRWYDGLPQEWRFQFILWPIIALGVVNMLLSLSIRFPFGLLVLLGVLFVAAVRVPFVAGWITPAPALASGEPGAPTLQIGGAGADWIAGLNERYEAVPEKRRFWIFPAILLIAGAINMQLTISLGWPFGLIFLLVLLAISVVRAPYVHGLLKPASAAGAPAPALQYNARIADERSPTPEPVRRAEPAVTAPAQHEGPAAEARKAAKPSADWSRASGPGRRKDAAMSSPPAPPRSEPTPGETEAVHPPVPNLGLASEPDRHEDAAISSPFAAPPRPELDEAEVVHPPAPKPPPGSPAA